MSAISKKKLPQAGHKKSCPDLNRSGIRGPAYSGGAPTCCSELPETGGEKKVPEKGGERLVPEKGGEREEAAMAYSDAESDISYSVGSETISRPPSAASHVGVPGPSGLGTGLLRKSVSSCSLVSDPMSRSASAAGRLEAPSRSDLGPNLAVKRSADRLDDVGGSDSSIFVLPGTEGADSASRGRKVKRGRGRPPVTGEYVGLAKARLEAQKAAREEARQALERGVALDAALLRGKRDLRLIREPRAPSIPAAEKLAHALRDEVGKAVKIVENVSTVSTGLKGTLAGSLKDAARSITEVTEALYARTSSEESERLRAANSRLEAEVAVLRRELDELRNEFAAFRREVQVPPPAPPPPPVMSLPATTAPPVPEEQMNYIMRNTSAMFEARYAGIYARLPPEPVIRPPLAADKKRGPPPPRPPPGGAFPPLPAPRAQRIVRRRPSTEDAPAVEEAPTAPPVVPAFVPPPVVPGRDALPCEGGFIVVTRGNKKRKAQTASQAQTGTAPVAPPATRQRAQPVARAVAPPPAWLRVPPVPQPRVQPRRAQPPLPPPKKTGPPKVRENRSAAVVLTLRPAAKEQGVSYTEILDRARSCINPVDLGIENGVRMRFARTGARMMVLPGADQGPKADALAARLREALDPEVVKVTRPEKTVRLRVSGLDDCTSTDEVAGAIERETGCPSEKIGSGVIRIGPDGSRILNVSCPVAAANKLAEKRRLLVGWASADVKILPLREPRCFRCLEPGHLSAGCKAVANRSGLCYRCGQPGHRAATCTAEPHCCVCSDKGRPAGHRVGGGPQPCTCRLTNAPKKAAAAAQPKKMSASAKKRLKRKLKKQRLAQQGIIATPAVRASGPEAMEEGGEP